MWEFKWNLYLCIPSVMVAVPHEFCLIRPLFIGTGTITGHSSPEPGLCDVKASSEYYTTHLSPVPVTLKKLLMFLCKPRNSPPKWVATSTDQIWHKGLTVMLQIYRLCLVLTSLSEGLFRQSLNGTGTRTNWFALYYVKVFTLQLQLYPYLHLYFGIRLVPVQFPVPLKFYLIKPWTCVDLNVSR